MRLALVLICVLTKRNMASSLHNEHEIHVFQSFRHVILGDREAFKYFKYNNSCCRKDIKIITKLRRRMKGRTYAAKSRSTIENRAARMQSERDSLFTGNSRLRKRIQCLLETHDLELDAKYMKTWIHGPTAQPQHRERGKRVLDAPNDATETKDESGANDDGHWLPDIPYRTETGSPLGLFYVPTTPPPSIGLNATVPPPLIGLSESVAVTTSSNELLHTWAYMYHDNQFVPRV